MVPRLLTAFGSARCTEHHRLTPHYICMYNTMYNIRLPILYTYNRVCILQYTEYYVLLGISRQLACMKLGSREKYQPIQYCWVHTSRLLGYLVSYMPFAYRYPTNLLQRTDRTAFALAVLILSCLHTVTIYYVHILYNTVQD